jgi:hypothetical protein
LWRLDDIKRELMARLRVVAAYQRADVESARAIDLELAWDLLGRAMRWMRALHVRLDDEAEAAKLAMPQAKRRPAVRLDWSDGRNLNGDMPSRRAGPLRWLETTDCIDGKPMAEVMAQICADLDAVAAVLGAAIPPQIAAIAAAARALLGGPVEGWTALPIVRAPPRVLEAGDLAPRRPPVPLPVLVPDTG